jgi:hypothetical protein
MYQLIFFIFFLNFSFVEIQTFSSIINNITNEIYIQTGQPQSLSLYDAPFYISFAIFLSSKSMETKLQLLNFSSSSRYIFQFSLLKRQLLYVWLQTSGITVDLLKALCYFLCCWSCIRVHTEATRSALGFQPSQEIER